jgi:hypothetical protein
MPARTLVYMRELERLQRRAERPARLLSFCKASALAAVALMCLAIGALAVRYYTMAPEVSKTVASWGDAGEGFAQIAQHLNDPKKGTIMMLDQDVGAAKSLIIHADLVARHEQQQLDTWDDRGTIIFNNANGTLTDLRGVLTAGKGTLDQATETLKIINDPKTGLHVVLVDADGVIKDLGTLTPDVQRAVKGLADTSEQTAGIGTHLNATTGDLQHALHPILNPDPCTTRACKFKRDLKALKAVGPGAEGLYYLIQIFSGF